MSIYEHILNLDLTGVVRDIKRQRRVEQTEYDFIVSDRYSIADIKAAIHRARQSDVPSQPIPYLNAPSLNAALHANDLELAKLLLDEGISPNSWSLSSGLAPVHEVASPEAIHLLDRYGANWQLKTLHSFRGKNPAAVAFDRDRPNVVEALLSHNPDALSDEINAITDREGIIGRVNSHQMLEILQKHGVITSQQILQAPWFSDEEAFRMRTHGLGVSSERLIEVSQAVEQERAALSNSELESDFAIVSPMRPLDHPREETTLFIIEKQLKESEEHRSDTHRVARGVAERLGAEDANASIRALKHRVASYSGQRLKPGDTITDEPLRVILRNKGVQEGRIIFSQSMGDGLWGNELQVLQSYQKSSTPNFAEYGMSYWDTVLNPVLFRTAGNEHDQGLFFQKDDMTLHAGRTMEIGAAEKHKDNWVLAYYSNITGGDILAPLVRKDGRLYSGTSFSAPFAAATYKELASRHGFGSGLSYDELAFAMMASTDKNVLSESAYRQEREWVKFNVNGAGLAYHRRAFSGVLNPNRADELASEMREAKHSRSLSDMPVRQVVGVDIYDYESSQLSNENASEYAYRLLVPEDMTLTKVSLYLPQEKNQKSAIILQSPSGYRYHLPVSPEGMVSTRAFFAEDVRAGEEFIIRTGTPLIKHKTVNMYQSDESPFMVFRGLEPNNTIAYMRDRMLQDDRLLPPLSEVGAERFQKVPQMAVMHDPSYADQTGTGLAIGLSGVNRRGAGQLAP